MAFSGDPPHFDPALTTSYFMLGAIGPVYDRLIRPQWGAYANPHTRDYVQLQGCILLIALVVVLINLLVDRSYAWFDPRIRYR